MKAKKVYIVFFIAILTVLSSCKGTSSALQSKDLKKESIKAIMLNYNKFTPKFNSMRGRLKCLFDDGKNQQNVNISYRFKKDQVLWMSAKLAGLIEIAKLKITPKKIQFYERIDQSYFDGNFQLVSAFLGLELNFNQIQNLLLAQALKPIEVETSDLISLEDSFQISTTYENNLNQILVINAKTFKLSQQILKQYDKEIIINYTKYQVINNVSFPEEIMIIAGDTDDKVSLGLSYKNINLNDDLRFPFRFPNNFKPFKF